MVDIDEVFPNPTVKQVIFQIRYPNLFYIENRIGEFQIKIMDKFPNSSLIHRKQIIFTDIGPDGKFDVPSDVEEETGKKVWQFESDKGFQLNITSDSLDITSAYHKTYNLDNGGSEKFRDFIEFVLENFFSVMEIPIATRIGLRYIDECPLFSKDNETFKEYYNSILPIERFDIALAKEMDFKTLMEKDNCLLRYIESLQRVNDEDKLILDFDAFTGHTKSEQCLDVTDKLHEIISEEYKKTIKKPVIEYMRQEN